MATLVLLALLVYGLGESSLHAGMSAAEGTRRGCSSPRRGEDIAAEAAPERGGRDPFTPDPSWKDPPPDDACGEELCRYKLDELKLVAIVSGDANPLAMFEDPRGKGIVAQRSSRIGKRGGRVVAIHRDCVTVEERREKHDICIRPASR